MTEEQQTPTAATIEEIYGKKEAAAAADSGAAMSSSPQVSKKKQQQHHGGKKQKEEKEKGRHRRRRHARRTETYSVYIKKVLNQVHPNMRLAKKSMSIMNSFVNDLFQRFVGEAANLTKYNRTSTLSSRDIQTTCCLILPGELARHAVSEGSKAMARFQR